MKVLIAEDNEEENRLYRTALEHKNHKVTVSRNGRECLDLYTQELHKDQSRNPFDVVVLDYKMPEMDGLSVAKEILALKKNQRLVFASAYVRETVRESVSQLEQVVSIVQKPFEPRVLVDIVEDIFTVNDLAKINEMFASIDPSAPNQTQMDELFAILKKIQKD
jgi:CheY-like chemotaxis protein